MAGSVPSFFAIPPILLLRLFVVDRRKYIFIHYYYYWSTQKKLLVTHLFVVVVVLSYFSGHKVNTLLFFVVSYILLYCWWWLEILLLLLYKVELRSCEWRSALSAGGSLWHAVWYFFLMTCSFAAFLLCDIPGNNLVGFVMTRGGPQQALLVCFSAGCDDKSKCPCKGVTYANFVVGPSSYATHHTSYIYMIHPPVKTLLDRLRLNFL